MSDGMSDARDYGPSLSKHGAPMLSEKGKPVQKFDGLEPARGVKIVCICGSTRFIDQMAIAAWEMEKKGILVIGPHLLPMNYPGVQRDHQAEAEGVREILDELHLRKIDLCDEVYVVDPGGYIGTSTKNELKYAQKKGKPIRYMEPVAG